MTLGPEKASGTFKKMTKLTLRDQAHVVAQLLKFSTPTMRRCTSLHGDQAFRLLRHEREKLAS